MVALGVPLLSATVGWAQPSPVPVDDFSVASESGVPAGWKPLAFKRIPRRTEYRVEREGGDAYLAARASASASGLLKELQVDLGATPVLRWRWRVSGAVQGADARAKAGDDYAARVYVAFAYDPSRASAFERLRYGALRALYGEYPPKAAINYVWDNRLPVGTSLDNAYTSRVKMVVLRSGDGDAGRWVEERVDVLEDYRRLFGGDPPRLRFIAVMTDTDDTAGYAEASYDDLAFSSR